MKRLRAACEKAKIELSNYDNTEIRVLQLAEGKDFLKRVTRKQFEEAAHALFERCKGPINRAMTDSRINLDEINDIVMVGGSSRIPRLKDILKDYFGDMISINDSINPDEVVAAGATVYAGVLSGGH